MSEILTREQVTVLSAKVLLWKKDGERFLAHDAALRAENKRLREALGTINLMCADGYYGPYSFTYAMEAKRLATVALAAGAPAGEEVPGE